MLARSVLAVAAAGGVALGAMSAVISRPVMKMAPLRPWQASGQAVNYHDFGLNFGGDQSTIPLDTSAPRWSDPAPPSMPMVMLYDGTLGPAPRASLPARRSDSVELADAAFGEDAVRVYRETPPREIDEARRAEDLRARDDAHSIADNGADGDEPDDGWGEVPGAPAAELSGN